MKKKVLNHQDNLVELERFSQLSDGPFPPDAFPTRECKCSYWKPDLHKEDAHCVVFQYMVSGWNVSYKPMVVPLK